MLSSAARGPRGWHLGAHLQAFSPEQHRIIYRIRKHIGSYIAALGGLDALVFTGGMGEGSAWVRALACHGLPYVGIQVDDRLNEAAAPAPGAAVDVSGQDSRVRVLVIPTDEGRMIARETIRTLGHRRVGEVISGQRDRKIPIEVSAHHGHLSKRELEMLFGPGYRLTHRAPLSQPGQYSCEKTVNLVGPNRRVERVRILGSLRSEAQAEISMTEGSGWGSRGRCAAGTWTGPRDADCLHKVDRWRADAAGDSRQRSSRTESCRQARGRASSSRVHRGRQERFPSAG